MLLLREADVQVFILGVLFPSTKMDIFSSFSAGRFLLTEFAFAVVVGVTPFPRIGAVEARGEAARGEEARGDAARGDARGDEARGDARGEACGEANSGDDPFFVEGAVRFGETRSMRRGVSNAIQEKTPNETRLTRT